MTEEELTQAVNGLREQINALVQRITRLEERVELLMKADDERSQFRRQILLAVIGFGITNVGLLVWALIKMLPK